MSIEDEIGQYVAAVYDEALSDLIGAVWCLGPHGTPRAFLDPSTGEPEEFMLPHGRCVHCGAQI